MRKVSFLVLLMLVISLSAPAMAGEPGRYSYVTIESVNITVLDFNKAGFEVDYSVDENVQFLVLLLGKGDLKDKLSEIFGYDDYTFDNVDMDHASFKVNIRSYNNGDGTYWFPEQKFKIEIPNITIQAQDNYKIFPQVKDFPGIGYYVNPQDEK
ncbi:hypothetical protein F1737_05795 [Methanoplanus sp. FWC-SCC4]|uniref:Uncharacterized protein n=1 Tax=Methanochimaera problematica TaxID=2609417 RepID=A0AA97FCC0_9EURY|nr:hypothetical protein [Methanoplanus sp. FWC-SCC4]WOF16257.1 hypothetical protein F1737_05795 [Methanoplanus sp. FWC-SCC4]